MTVARFGGNRIRLTSRSGRFFFTNGWGLPISREGVPCPGRWFYVINGSMIPYTGIGLGISVIFGIWAFLVAETLKERAILAGIPVIVFLIPVIIPSPVGRLISMIGWMMYGLGCIIYLRYNGMEIR